MKRTLLIVEDESDFVITLGLQAKSRGYHCEIDMTGADAVSRALQCKPSAVLLDMNLPAISGLGLVCELRGYTELEHVPIIILSAINHADVVKEALDRGADAYFSKAGNMPDLFTMVQEYIDHSSSFKGGPTHFS